MNPINGIFGGVVLILGLGLYLLFNAYTSQVEQRVAFEVQAKISEETLRLQKEFTKKNQLLMDSHNTKLKEINSNYEEARNEINTLRLTAERDAQLSPYGFGNNLDIKLKRLFCLLEAGNNHKDVETCRSAPNEAFNTTQSLLVTITPKRAERSKELCEDARDGRIGRDFLDECHWSITGFTPQGILTLLMGLESQLKYNKDLDSYSETLREIIKELSDREEKSP